MIHHRFLAQLAGVVLAVIGLTSPSSAGGPVLVVEDPAVAEAMVPATSHDWQGLYVGLAASQPNGSNAWHTEAGGGGFSGPADWTGKHDILVLGYNFQRGQMVYGVELNYSSGNLRSETLINNGIIACGSYSGCATEVSGLVELRGRVGLARNRSLFYLTGGFASAKVDGLYALPEVSIASKRMSGYSVGLGVEVAIGKHAALRAEYSHTELGKMNLPTICSTCSVKPAFDSFRLGLTFRF